MLKDLSYYATMFNNLKARNYTLQMMYADFGNFGITLDQQPAEFATLLNMIYDLQPSTIIEIGQWYGGTLQYWLHHFPNTRIIGIDIDHSKLQERIKNHKNLTLITSDSGDRKTVSKLKSIVNEVDFLFIDGYHYYPTVWKDYVYYSKFVRKNGLIALHDINWKFENNDKGVGNVWKHIKKRNTNVIEMIQDEKLDLNFWYGIGVCVK